MVFAFAGDSTTTSVAPAAPAFFTAAGAAVLAGAFFLAIVFAFASVVLGFG